jgi:hypothetical protein
VPTPLNILLRDGFTTHPDTNVTITRYTTTAFTPTNDFTAFDQIITPTGGTSEASRESPIKYWVYFSNLESTDDTSGYWSLSWEERVN